MQFAWELPPGLPRRLVPVVPVLALGAVAYWWFSAPVETTPAPHVVVRRESVDVQLVVDVVGQVRHPGVVRLPSGARVLDAIAAAGGVRPGHAPIVNMARKVVDGEQIVVGAGATGTTQSSRISINTATASQLEQLPGVGPILAKRIVDYRTAHGPFARIRDLLDVPGIGDAKYAEIADAASL